jgi:hypothetical protein
MATLEQLERGLIAADAAGNVEDARAFANAIRAVRAAEPKPDPAEGMSTTEKVLTGIGGGLARMRDTMFPPGSPIDALTMSQTGDNGRARKADLATYEANKAALGTAGAVGEVIPEVVASAVPVSRAGALISKAPVLAKTLGRLAPAAGDIAANAGYSALTADGDRGAAALAGGAGAAGGRLLTRTLGGLARPFVSKDARTLMDAGIRPTPGQLFGDGPIGGTVRALEDRASSFPLVGDVINHGRRRALNEYGSAEINAALRPLGVTVRGSGEDAVEAAARAVSDSYDRVLPQVYITPQRAMQAVQDAATAVKQIPLLTVEQEGALMQYVARKVRPAIQDAMSKGQPIDGQIAKRIDSEIGHLARERSGSLNPSDHSLGEAFYELQASLRGALEGMTPDATKLLGATNAAYRQMLPVLKAADRAKGQGGRFTPLQFNRASGQYGQTPSGLNQAGRNVLPSTVPDSGTAGRVLLGAGAAGGVALGGPLTAATAAAALYSGPGMSFLVNGLRSQLSDKAYAYIRSLPPQKAVEFIAKLAERQPAIGVTANQLIAQIGRAAATQQPQAETQP